MSVAVYARQQCATGTQRVCNCTSTNWKTCFAAAVGGGRRRLLERLLLDAQAHCRLLLLVTLLRAASVIALTCSYSIALNLSSRVNITSMICGEWAGEIELVVHCTTTEVSTRK